MFILADLGESTMAQVVRDGKIGTVAANAQAFADQAALVERHGGRKTTLALGAPGATPPPAS